MIKNTVYDLDFTNVSFDNFLLVIVDENGFRITGTHVPVAPSI